MRAYFFGNMYLSSIQQGIQAAHVVAEMFVRYNDPERPLSVSAQQAAAILNTWARDHKTMVLLNAGYGQEIHNLIDFFNDPPNPFPWSAFNEGDDALDGALTCIGIILPEEIYNASKALREGPKGDPMQLLTQAVKGDMTGLDPWNGYKPTMWEQELAARLNNYGLAR